MASWSDITNGMNTVVAAFDGVGNALVQLAGMMTGMKNAVSGLVDANVNLTRGLDAQIGMNTALIETFMEAAENALYLEKRNQTLAKSFGVSAKKSLNMGSSLQKLVKDFEASGEQLQQYSLNLQKIIPTINQFTKDMQGNRTYRGLMRVQQVMITSLGLTAEQAEKFSGYAAQFTGMGVDALDQLKTQENISKGIEAATGLQGSFKIISEEIAALTEDVQIQYGHIPGNLELAVVKAKQLGLNMTTLFNTGKKLLSIEESIGSELEYQLLSGRRLVDEVSGKSLTNSYREATLMGDANKQADVLNTLLKQEGKTLRQNLFARQQMSELLGMDEAALSRALQKRSILESLPGGDALFEKTGDALIAGAKAMGATEGQIQDLVDSEDTRTTDDILKQILFVQMETTGFTKEMLENQNTYNDPARQTIAQQALGGSLGTALIDTNQVGLTLLGGSKLVTDVALQMASVIVNTIKDPASTAAKYSATKNLKQVNTNDAIIMPDGNMQINPHPQDAMVLMKPNGPIQQGLSDVVSNNGQNNTAILQAIYNELVRQTSAVKDSNKMPTWSTGNLGGVKLYG